MTQQEVVLDGGSINIFYDIILSKGTVIANGGPGAPAEKPHSGYSGTPTGGTGGMGCISIGSISTGTYEPTKDSFNITKNGENVTITGNDKVNGYGEYEATLVPQEGYNINNISVKMGEKILDLGTDYTYENGTLTILTIQDDIVITAKAIQLTANEYGRKIRYNANGVDDWKIFYNNKETSEIFIITSDYLENTKLPENIGMTTQNKYQAYFENIPDENAQIEPIVRNRFLMNWNNRNTTANIKCVSKLLNTAQWQVFAQRENSYAIGSPTIEMWIKSWNDIYESEKLFYSTTNVSDGYFINDREENTESTNIEYDTISKLQGYNNELYYPHKRKIQRM